VTLRGTLGLLVAATSLLAVVWVDRAPILPQRPLPTPDTPALLDAPIASVARVEWQRGPERLTLVRTPAGWHDAAGHPWPADVVEVALDALASLHPHTVVADEAVDLAQYGLAPAAERLRVLDGTGHELLAMDIGNRNPAWTGSYARRAGRPEVLLVGALLRWELDKLRSARDAVKQP
jgi:Domain of unknown function (DUF4340)